MKQKLNKNDTINLIKKATNIECYVEYKNNSFTINLKGDIVPKQDQEITLKSIYELVISLRDGTNKKLDTIDKRLEKMENEIKEIKNLPTISTEIKEKELYEDYYDKFSK